MTTINKRHCFEKGNSNIALLEQCERLSFSSRVYLKTEQQSGQRFHQQKRIETKTEQCERSLIVENSLYLHKLHRIFSESRLLIAKMSRKDDLCQKLSKLSC